VTTWAVSMNATFIPPPSGRLLSESSCDSNFEVTTDITFLAPAEYEAIVLTTAQAMEPSFSNAYSYHGRSAALCTRTIAAASTPVFLSPSLPPSAPVAFVEEDDGIAVVLQALGGAAAAVCCFWLAAWRRRRRRRALRVGKDGGRVVSALGFVPLN
jgi:hypothetical protein